MGWLPLGVFNAVDAYRAKPKEQRVPVPAPEPVVKTDAEKLADYIQAHPLQRVVYPKAGRPLQ